MIFRSRTSGPPPRTRFIALVAFSLASVAPAIAQAPAGSNWDHLKAITAGTKLHVTADKGGRTCKLVSVDDASLLCGKHTFARSEVKTVKLTRYAVSYLGGAGIGAAVGAGVGLGATAGQSSNSFDIVSRGEVVSTSALAGGLIGAIVTGPADLFKGPTVYRRP